MSHHLLFWFCTGGYIVISHPLGRQWLEGLHKEDPVQVPHLLPDQARLEALTADLPLRLHSYVDEADLYIATLQVGRRHICYVCVHHVRGDLRLVQGVVTSTKHQSDASMSRSNICSSRSSSISK